VAEENLATVWALVALPPPVTGLTLLTEKVVQRLQLAGPVRCIDWSPKKLPRGWRFRAVRAWRVLASIGEVIGAGRAATSRLYVAANSRAGLYLTLLLAAIGRWRAHEVFLHHHSYLYLDQYDRRMAWICFLLGTKGVHVVACQQMEREFQRLYPAACRFAHINPSLVAGSVGEPRTAPGRPFVVGHLGNLSEAKGIDVVLETFRALHGKDNNIRLKLAGPFYPGKARQLVTRAIADFPDAVEWIGPVFGQQKRDFFSQIDCFVFPTRSESWGIVLNEAMGAGIPVIAADRGCIRTVVGGRAGLVVENDESFSGRAAEQVLAWIENPREYRAASAAACEQARFLQQDAADALESFVDRVFDRSAQHRRSPAESLT
jgi:glycosyltransferase involved in cell wall biosynthesis